MRRISSKFVLHHYSDGGFDMKIAILYICVGNYHVFWKDFFLSAEKYFLPNVDKDYFVFTDSKHIFQEDNTHIIKVYQDDLGWPKNTLLRYHLFDSQYEKLKTYDYLVFFNANCLFVDTISILDFLPVAEDLVFVNHPIFYDKSNMEFTYERNPKSTAFIPFGEGTHYISGGVNGGKAAAFLSMAKELRSCVDHDSENNVIALWHDESHINKYALNHPNYRLLDASFFFPEGWEGPFIPKIVAREKSKYINVDKLKNHKVGLKHRIKHLLRRITKRMVKF